MKTVVKEIPDHASEVGNVQMFFVIKLLWRIELAQTTTNHTPDQ